MAFRVPNEDEKAATTKIEVTFPAEHPLRSVKVRPVSGWKADITSDQEHKEGAEEPERPAPVLRLTPASGSGRVGSGDIGSGPSMSAAPVAATADAADGVARAFGIAGLWSP